MLRITDDFKSKLLEEIINFRKYGNHIEYITGISIVKKHIVLKLANNNIPFKVLNLGAGVSKITTRLETCPKCNGTGKV